LRYTELLPKLTDKFGKRTWNREKGADMPALKISQHVVLVVDGIEKIAPTTAEDRVLRTVALHHMFGHLQRDEHGFSKLGMNPKVLAFIEDYVKNLKPSDILDD
jgi:hypothetical protein